MEEDHYDIHVPKAYLHMVVLDDGEDGRAFQQAWQRHLAEEQRRHSTDADSVGNQTHVPWTQEGVAVSLPAVLEASCHTSNQAEMGQIFYLRAKEELGGKTPAAVLVVEYVGQLDSMVVLCAPGTKNRFWTINTPGGDVVDRSAKQVQAHMARALEQAFRGQPIGVGKFQALMRARLLEKQWPEVEDGSDVSSVGRSRPRV